MKRRKMDMVLMRVICILPFYLFTLLPLSAQPRMRVIVDNDFGGDPDGLFQLAHQVLSASTEVVGIVGSHHYDDFFGNAGTAAFACNKARELLEVMGIRGLKVYEGAEGTFADEAADVPLPSAGASAIVVEAMRDDPRPLYVLCGAGLTNIASAWIIEPRIADRITAVVWIGGAEYADLCRNQLQKQREYNQGIDPIAAQIVFNRSSLRLWQIPRDTYRQALCSVAELQQRVGNAGKTGEYLMDCLAIPFRQMHGGLGETYILGDSPLTLVTALQSPWEADASSSEYVTRPAPRLLDNGFYEDNPEGRPIRVFTKIDTRLMIEDFISKILNK